METLAVHDDWYRRETLYQIYPLSFADSDGDGFGDIQGIIDHLDYLNDGTPDSLGIGAIWLCPLYRSPMVDWGYDVTDHCAIDPRFGTMHDFERLVNEVHRRGMKLLMDFVPNHTSILHPWFVRSRSSRRNPKRDWYVWSDPAVDGGPPNNWVSDIGGSAWSRDATTGQYYLHTFLPEQPDLNWRNPVVRDEMLNVLRFWLDKGVDGFRSDAIYGLLKDEKLRDDLPNPQYEPDSSLPGERFLRVHSAGQRELSGVIESFCEVVAKRPGRFLLSEAYLDIPGLRQLYKACRKHPVHAPFNFNLMKLPWSAASYRGFIDAYEASLGPDDWPNYVLGNHDRSRLVSRVGIERARLLALLQLTLRGLPVVYYGEELGLPDSKVARNQQQDQWGIRAGIGRDGERTPMPWDASNNVGFTTSKPWLPIDPLIRRLNVEQQTRDPQSCFNLYRHLIELRKTCPALMEGKYYSVQSDNDDVFVYVRQTSIQRFLVVLNFADRSGKVHLDGVPGRWIAGTHMVTGDGALPGTNELLLRAYEGRLYELDEGFNHGSRL